MLLVKITDPNAKFEFIPPGSMYAAPCLKICWPNAISLPTPVGRTLILGVNKICCPRTTSLVIEDGNILDPTV